MNRPNFPLDRTLALSLTVAIAAITLVSIIFWYMKTGGPGPGTGDDKQRLHDLALIQTALANYFAEHGSYPSAYSYDLLCRELFPGDDPPCPHDPKEFQDYEYVPVCDESGCTAYVLKAFFDDTEYPALANDLDNIVNGLDCSDPAYCVKIE